MKTEKNTYTTMKMELTWIDEYMELKTTTKNSENTPMATLMGLALSTIAKAINEGDWVKLQEVVGVIVQGLKEEEEGGQEQ